jgi:hypothetical protein
MVSELGRPPGKQPAKLWDYRRMKMMVDVLAALQPETAEFDAALEALCSYWGVSPIWDKDGELNEAKTIHMLAKHTLEHGRKKS